MVNMNSFRRRRGELLDGVGGLLALFLLLAFLLFLLSPPMGPVPTAAMRCVPPWSRLGWSHSALPQDPSASSRCRPAAPPGRRLIARARFRKSMAEPIVRAVEERTRHRVIAIPLISDVRKGLREGGIDP
jgi:hypothetical protein